MAEPVDRYAFLTGGGEAAELIAAFDWSKTAMGPIADWPPSVTIALSLILRSPIPIVTLWYEDGVMIYNDGYSEFAGGRHPQLLGSNVREGWPEVADFNDNIMKVGLAGGTLAYRDFELSLNRRGRFEPVWLNLDYSPLLDEAGKPIGVMAIVVEITEKVRAERWLDGERERLRRMFEQAPSFMALLRGPEHVFEFVNPAYAQLIGHRDVIGKPIREALPDIAGQGYFELLDTVLATGEPFIGAGAAVSIQRTPGEPEELRYLDFLYQPLVGPDGGREGIFVEGVDVTERREAEAAVRAAEARNRQILDSVLDSAIISFDVEGKVTRWNAGAQSILGWTEAEMLGQPISRFFTPEDAAADRPGMEMRSALERGLGRDEGWRVRKSGERFWASGEMRPIHGEADQVVGFVKLLRDRTDEYRTNLALADYQARLGRAQEAGEVGLFSVTLDDNLVHATPQFYRLYGLEGVDEMPAETISALVEPEDRPLIAGLRTRPHPISNLQTEYRIRRADTHELRWIARRAEYEYDGEDRPVRLVGVVQDVTERRMAQRAAEESAAQFRALAEAMPNQVWTARPNGLLDWFNPRVYDYAGARPGDLDGEGWAALVHPDDLPAANARWTQSLIGGAIYETEFRIRRADGTYRWHLVRALPIRDADGAITRWVGANTDIDDRKIAEVEINRDRERIWASTNDLMAVVGVDGRLRSVNPAWTRLLGYAEADLVDRPLAEIVAPEDRARLSEVLKTLAKGDPVNDLEDRVVHKDGRTSLIAWSAEPAGEIAYIVGRDVTEQRAAEEALRQSQKMEAVGQLTGGIAHDFNNLLQGITGSLDLVQKRISQGRLGDLDRFVTGAMTSAGRAAALTHRLLAFSRRQPLDPRPVRANPLVASMEDLLRRTLGERIELELVLAGGLWLTKCDPNQLESAILNLAINARDAMPNGGKLTIETCNTHLDNAYAAKQRDVRPGQYICVCVTDTGAGMSADVIAKAFEPFFTTKPIGQGTGLGLSMIYGFTRQSEGYAKIYSEVGQGTTVKLYLPRFRGATEEDEPAPVLSEQHRAHAEETVLVVEDESVVRGLIVEVLNDLGYHAIEAADGPSGLEILQSKRRIDLLITDVGLPGLNGRQVADAGRALRPGLKVLFMTGYAENAALASGFLEPGMAMITKPFAMDALATRIREIAEED